MEITINQAVFKLSELSKIESENFQVTITEPGFNEKNAKLKNEFKETPIFFPEFIERLIKRTTYRPLTKIYQDEKDKLKLETNF